MLNKIIIVFSSHLGDEKNSAFINHVHNTIGCNHDVFCYTNYNQYSLPEVYNRAIKEHNEENAIMVFCHCDIYIKTPNWGKILLTKFNNSDFQIIGVAGSPYLDSSGVWWQDRSKMVGVVEHTDGYRVWVNEYAPPVKGKTIPVVVIDGLFMAIDCNGVDYYFDEDFKGYHYYDLPMVINNYIAGCNIGVTTDIRILHQSIGMTNQQWENNRQLFVEKYKNKLPILITEFDDRTKNDNILVNVITRTHDREKYFNVCKESIMNQTHKNVNHIVGSDVECNYCENYIKLELQPVQYPQPMVSTYPAPWNLHLNELAKHVKDGWVLYLDDDDKFSYPNSLRILVNNIDNEDQLLLWKVNINGWIVPSDENFGKIVAGNISGIGMMFHSKHLPVDWGSWSYGDFRVISQLTQKIKPKWINYILTQTQGNPNNGKQPKN